MSVGIRLQNNTIDTGAAALRLELARVQQREMRAEHALAILRAKSERLRARCDPVSEARPEAWWDMAAHGADPTDPVNPFWWSDQFRCLLGFVDETDFPNLLGSWSSRLHPEDAAPTLAAFAAHLNDCTGRTAYDVTYRLRCRNGEYRWFGARGTTTRAADGTALRVAGYLRNETQPGTAGYRDLAAMGDNPAGAIIVMPRKATVRPIGKLALYDSLTGLPNRTLFMDHMKRALFNCERRASRLVLLVLDLERFKEINDSHGHDTGDQVLTEVARRLQSSLRPAEMLARLAGDAFVVFAESGGEATARLVGERMLEALAAPVALRGHAFALGASIGSAVYPGDGGHSEELLRHAGIAMHRAKAAGGGQLAYHAAMSAGLAERIEIADSLALALKAGRLELYYQPKIHLQTGSLRGAEALLRWNDPRRGPISPATFIPVAEARGMIGALGNWVLHEACRQLQAWRAAGHRFTGRLALNLAAQQLEQADFAQQTLATVRAAGLSADCFELELTESGLMGNVELAIAVMGELRAAGFSLSIDDFGTGYSSLSYLKRLPVDTLKIDISFVRDMLKAHQDYIIVTAIIGMASKLGLKVIAEGVEESAQAQALLALGCDDAQGYYFGHPVLASEFARRWLANGCGAPDPVAARRCPV